MPSIENVTSSSQKERLWQIDFLARFRGFVTRQDLVDRFQIALSNATRDLTLYRELAPDNLEYSASDKSYRRTSRYAPLFNYDATHTLQVLSHGQARGFDPFHQAVVVESAQNLNEPSLDILSELSLAIYQGSAVKAKYVSVASGASTLLMPVTARRQLYDLSDDMATKIDIQFYQDARDALLKALVE